MTTTIDGRHVVMRDGPQPSHTVMDAQLAGARGKRRPAGPVAAAWAVLHHLGRDGYRQLARQIVDANRRLIAGVEAIDGLIPYPARPELSIWLITSTTLDIHGIAAAMETRGWVLFRCREPAGIHILGDPFPDELVDRFLEDLKEVTATMDVSGSVAQPETGYRA